MQSFDNICRSCNSVKLKIKYRWKDKEEEEITSQDILPKNFCILAFHSIYPYMQTYFTGGWFNWVNYNEHVIVNCPHPEGIAMYIKSINKNSSSVFRVEVMKNSCKCYKRYSLRDSFYFNFNEENVLRYGMLDKIIPFFDRFSLKDRSPIDFSCIYKGEKILFNIK